MTERADRKEERIRDHFDKRTVGKREHAMQQGKPDPGYQKARDEVVRNWSSEEKKKGKNTNVDTPR